MAKPSPAQPGRVEEEKAGQGGNGEGRSVAKEASRPALSLLDLLDELLVQIFEQAPLATSPSPSPQSYLPTPTSLTLVNRPFYTLARTVWWRRLRSPTNVGDLDDFLSDLLDHENVHAYVSSIDLAVPLVLSSVALSITARLENLASLSVTFHAVADGEASRARAEPTHATGSEVGPVMHARFAHFVRRLPHLVHLIVHGTPHIGPRTLALDSDCPSLRSLDTASPEPLRIVLSNGATRLASLCIRSDTLAGLTLPWQTIEHISFAPASGTVQEPQVLLDSLRAALGSPRPFQQLRRLTLDFPCTQAATVGNGAFHCGHLRQLFPLLQPSRLLRFDLTNVNTLDWTNDLPALSSIVSLTLSGSARVTDEIALAQLHTLLSTFPSLASLHVTGFSMSTILSQSAVSLSQSGPVPFPICCPFFHALLSALHATAVVDFRFRNKADDTDEMRWTRSLREEDCVGKRWTLG